MSENQPNFEPLRRLLALKRHETPPPGYFNNFSRQVMARIRTGEAEAPASLSERLFAGMPWLLKWLEGLEAKPVFAGGFASALCLLLLFGALVAQQSESVSQAFLQPATQEDAPVASFASATPAVLPQPVNQMMVADNSTNPLINFQSTYTPPLGQIPLGAQFVNYSYPAGN
ncbi:MAG: hypothetical protein WBN22_07970 [Verrucomicrobiia bacterium]